MPILYNFFDIYKATILLLYQNACPINFPLKKRRLMIYSFAFFNNSSYVVSSISFTALSWVAVI